MKKSWGEFYSETDFLEEFFSQCTVHKEFLQEIIVRHPKNILEAGCGTAVMSFFLSLFGGNITACDNDPLVLQSAYQVASLNNVDIEFTEDDILKTCFKNGEFDVSFSQGVLEHFSDKDILATIKEMLRISRTFIFSVPSYYYKHKDFGNERLMKVQEWRDIISQVPCSQYYLKEYYYQKTKRNLLIDKPLMIMGIIEL